MADKSLESASTVPSSYQVFLSFRGEDTRNKFIAHLYNALVDAGIETYKDDQKLERGEEIEPSLLQAIQDSRISIPVFSENYASSTWCLRELTEIIKCRRERGQTVLPVFFSADPSDVRGQTGSSFEKAFLGHEERFGKETVDRWREAMTEAANLSGWNLKDAPANGNEAELVKLVVKAVWSKLNDDTHLDVAKHPVGIDSHVKYMMTKFLNVEPSKAFFVGICGMGGIGKTTIAKAVFNKIFSLFEGSCFLDDVRENSKQKGLVSLQSKLLSNILKGSQDIDTVSRGITMIKERMRTKKVLIVLDDVDNNTQLNSLAGGLDWFGSGSRIIISTRDEQVLIAHGVDKIYKPKEMDLNQSLQLFSKHAFGRDQPLEDYMDLSKKIVHTTRGLPLALEVLGSCLIGKREQSYWESTLNKLKKIPRLEVQKKLQISFDELDYEAKQIFLDIACFFIGMDKEAVIYIWDGFDFSSTIGIEVLIKKSLVKIGDDNKLRMHDQLRDMGREIVREDGGRDPGKYSRLWDRLDVFDVLKKQMGSTNVKGLVLDFRPRLRTEAFAGMSQLRLLRVDYAHIDGDFEHFPPELRWLSWRGCPLEFIPTNFHMEKLTVLDLSNNHSIKQVWNDQNQVVKTLKVLDLSHCTNLIRTPDFAGFRCLERLNLQGCSRLEEVHRSIGNLKKLIYLNLEWCGSLVEVPSSIFKLDSLKDLFLSGCSTLKKLPDLDGMKSLRKLYLDGTAIEQLPDSIGCLKNLSVLSLPYCKSLRILPNLLGKLESLRELFLDKTAIEQLPDSIGCLKNLSVLSLKECISLRILPNSLGKLESLRELRLDESGVEELPFSIGALKKLEILSLVGCLSLTVLPNSIGDLESLSDLQLFGSAVHELPSSIGCLLKLPRLSLEGCKFLGKLPDTLWRIESLIELNLEWIEEIREIPEFHGSQSKLEKLTIRFCKSFSRLPDSMGNLESLRELILYEIPIENIPDSIGSLKKLEILSTTWCKSLTKLPDSISNVRHLTKLLVDGTLITELPNGIGSLEKLEMLSTSRCKKLVKLPDSMGNLESLRKLILDGTPIENIPDSIGSLKKLEILSTKWCESLTNLPDSISNVRNLTTLKVDGTLITELPNGIGSLEKLEELSVSKCKKLVELPDSMGNLRLLKKVRMAETGIVELPKIFRMLRSLKVLDISGCQEFKGLPENFASLSQLNDLKVAYCTKLQYLPELPSSLVELDVRNCISLERLADLSNLEKLEVLTLSNCEKLLEIEGIERLKSLSELSMIGCNNINRNTLRKIFVQGAFECLRTFSFPGSDIPDWFAHQKFPSVVCIPPDYEIDRLIVCGILSCKDVDLSIYRPSGFSPLYPFHISKTDIYRFSFDIRMAGRSAYHRQIIIRGTPKTNEDQVCLFYYQPNDYSLRNWKNGDEIEVFIRQETGICNPEIEVFIRRETGICNPEIYGKKAAVHVAYRPVVRGLESKAMEDDKQLSHIHQKLADFYTCDAGGGSQHSVVVAPEPVEATMPSKKRKLSIRDRDTTLPRSRRHGRAISVRNIRLGCWLRLSMRRMLSGKRPRRDESCQKVDKSM